jgi:hypothetical protein
MPKETHYSKLLRRVIDACPKGMRAVAILATPEEVGVYGSCCDGCTDALIHHVADERPDPRESEALVEDTSRVH